MTITYVFKLKQRTCILLLIILTIVIFIILFGRTNQKVCIMCENIFQTYL